MGRVSTFKIVAIVVRPCCQEIRHGCRRTDHHTSNFGAKETVDRLEAEITAKDMTVFARIDHAAAAAAVGLPLPPTELLIFGNAKGGTPLMQADPAMGIDLPLKALVYEDKAGKVWLSYNDPRWLAQRHGLSVAVTQIINAMAAALDVVAAKATKRP